MTQYVLRVEPIGVEAWIRIVAIATTILIAMELHKALRRPGAHEAGKGRVRRSTRCVVALRRFCR